MENSITHHSQIPFKKKFKTFWLGYQDIECPSTGVTYKHTFRNRILGGVVAGFSPSIAYVWMNYYTESVTLTVVYSILLTIFFGLLLSLLCARFFTFKKVTR